MPIRSDAKKLKRQAQETEEKSEASTPGAGDDADPYRDRLDRHDDPHPERPLPYAGYGVAAGALAVGTLAFAHV